MNYCGRMTIAITLGIEYSSHPQKTDLNLFEKLDTTIDFRCNGALLVGPFGFLPKNLLDPGVHILQIAIG